MPTASGGEEFHIRGHAIETVDLDAKGKIMEATGGRQGTREFESPFRCRPESVLYTKREGRGTEKAWQTYSKRRS
ncbi:MAG: hypothetical protein MJA83_08320 [Gammaproteobacteria bacterium]|nr:hypothetical protein [Gammaproteobacteria bacterium]